MSRGARVTVAGAGALGLSSALALADAGCDVTVWDPAPETNASAVAGGMIAPAFEAALDAQAAPAFDLLMAARNLWPALEARSDVILDRSGAVGVGPPAWLGALQAGFVRLGLRMTELPRPTLEDLAPGLSPAFADGLMTREDWRLEPGQAMAALRAAATAAGVAFRTRRAADAGEGDWLVVATGADPGLANVAPELARLTPIKGHILRLAGAAHGRCTVRAPDIYAVPGDGGLALGATMEVGVSDPNPDPAQAERLLSAGVGLFPALGGARPQVFAGVRAATPDGLPMVGPSEAERVILAVGARRNGWLLAPLVAQVVAACVTERDPGPYAARLHPARFGGGA